MWAPFLHSFLFQQTRPIHFFLGAQVAEPLESRCHAKIVKVALTFLQLLTFSDQRENCRTMSKFVEKLVDDF